MERERDASKGGQLKLIDLAVAADECWRQEIPGFGYPDGQSFRKLYAIVYRHTSAFAHPSWRGLHRVTLDTGPITRGVAMEQGGSRLPVRARRSRDADRRDGLLVAGAALPWPAREQVVAIFDRCPGDRRRSWPVIVLHEAPVRGV